MRSWALLKIYLVGAGETTTGRLSGDSYVNGQFLERLKRFSGDFFEPCATNGAPSERFFL
jgi:hypothetical protein